MEAQTGKTYWTWKFEIDMKIVVAIIFIKHWICKGTFIHKKLKCSEELKVFLAHRINLPYSRLLEAPHSLSRYSADVLHLHNIVTFLFWVHLTTFWFQTTIRLRPQIENPWMVGLTALDGLNLTPIVLLPARLHWRISANPKRLSLAKSIAWLSSPNFLRIKRLDYWRETKKTYSRRRSVRNRFVLLSVGDITVNNELEGTWHEDVCHNLSISACAWKKWKPQKSEPLGGDLNTGLPKEWPLSTWLSRRVFNRTYFLLRPYIIGTQIHIQWISFGNREEYLFSYPKMNMSINVN